MKRSRSKPGFRLDDATGSELLAVARTKTSLVKTLENLSGRGYLAGIDDEEDDAPSEKQLKRQLTAIAASTPLIETPYGRLTQEVKVDFPGLTFWEIVNPFALLYHMCILSVPFACLMKSLSSQSLRLVIFADGLITGNAFRQDRGRSVMCLYWCFVDWPSWLLHRSFAWPVLGLLRERILDKIAGGLGRLMRFVLRLFFMAGEGHSFERGVHLPHPDGDFMITAFFSWFLGDLAGHKEINAAKGSSGVYCCWDCDNVVNIRKPKRGEVSIACPDVSKFRRRSNEQQFAILDDLAATFAAGGNTGRFKTMQTEKGFNYVPEGLMLDQGLRSLYQPQHHHVRDWMHTLCQDGLANYHMGCLLNAMHKQCGVAVGRVQEFADLCNLPHKYGRLDDEAFSSKRLRTNSMPAFAGQTITMVYVLQMFLEQFLADRLPQHVAAFTLLYRILGLFRLGPEGAMSHVQDLKRIMTDHLELLVELYGDNVKPKAHQLFHVLDGMEWIGKLLSCFVTERKHRSVKRSALHVYRHFEHTATVDVLNTSLQQIKNGLDLYKPFFLISPRIRQIHGSDFLSSRSAVLHCGETWADDVVITHDGDVALVIRFFARVGDDSIIVELDRYRRAGADARLRATDSPSRVFMNAQCIFDSVIWCVERHPVIRISLPPSFI